MAKPSEDNVLIQQITATHVPDGREIDIKPILQIVEDILTSATITTPDSTLAAETETLEEKSNSEALATMLEELSYIIHRLSCEISYKCMGGGDGHPTAVSLLKLLSSFSWETKMALTLAVFALNYGEFWLFDQIRTTNRLAGRMAILKQSPFLLDDTAPMKPRFDALNDLVQTILNLTRCIFQFTEIPKKYISQDNLEYSTAIATFPVSVYWIFRSLIACATNIAHLSGMGHEYRLSAPEAWELSSLTFKIRNINEHLQKQLAISKQYAEEKMNAEIYELLLRAFQAVHTDNMEVLKLLTYHKDDQLPLFDGAAKKRVNFDVLRSKTVLLLISGLDISLEEVLLLGRTVDETRAFATMPESQYEVVWFPVVDRSTPWTESNQQLFETLQSTKMAWYSVYHPSIINTAVIRFFKENLHFNKKTLLVVLDPQGKIVRPDALRMTRIWGSNAYPFTSSREEALWSDETWTLKFLVDGIDAVTMNWISEGKHIILYGADDTEWIRKFTNAARVAARDAGLQLEMVYAGNKNSKREQILKAMQVIDADNLSHRWPDYTGLWFFWARLESMLFSKIELGCDDEKDDILQEVKKLLSYEKTGPWALFSKGSEVILTGNGDTALSALEEYETWKKDVEETGFGPAFKDHYEKLHEHASHPCCRFEFQNDVGRKPGSMKCPECRRSMKKFKTFTCCHE